MHIYVAKLAMTATADDVRQLFEPYGLVEHRSCHHRLRYGPLQRLWVRRDA
jgi:hypothetical protein